MNKNIDFKIDKKTVINAHTKELAIEVCNLLDKLGAKWRSGKSYVDYNNWDDNKHRTCYDVYEGCYGDILCYRPLDHRIIAACDFLKLHEPSEQKLEKREIDFKIDNRTVINARTEEEAIELCNFLDKLGAEWSTKTGDPLNSKYSKNTRWSFLKEDTCYFVHGGITYGKNYCIKQSYNIITVSDFLKLHGVDSTSDKTTETVVTVLKDVTHNQVDLLINITDGHINPKKISMVKDVNQTDTGTCIKYNIEILL